MDIIRRVLVVDDDEYIEETSVREYIDIFDEMKGHLSNLDYSLEFHIEHTLESAQKILNRKDQVFDVLVIDYDFTNDPNCYKGLDLIKKIRSAVNTRCQIIFYTMNSYHDLRKEDFIDLLNNDVFRFILKDGKSGTLQYEQFGEKADQLIVEAIVDAIQHLDPISIALEKYLSKYTELSDNLYIQIDGKKCSIEDIVLGIRLDNEIGNIFINNLFEMAILEHIKMKG